MVKYGEKKRNTIDWYKDFVQLGFPRKKFEELTVFPDIRIDKWKLRQFFKEQK